MIVVLIDSPLYDEYPIAYDTWGEALAFLAWFLRTGQILMGREWRLLVGPVTDTFDEYTDDVAMRIVGILSPEETAAMAEPVL